MKSTKEDREEVMGEVVPGGGGRTPGGVNAPEASGRNPLARRMEGTTFPVTTGRGVKRIAS